ncbi:hypothetical protein [Methanohalobium sp.]|uniref:hypothetical protein n=1 Tax=Methanohalobium sp. TaxID=2837493 RepID=UPI0025D85ED6|nr:hypothetical protein [Methanohalobium sp.]
MSQVDGTIHEVYIKDGARINIRGKWKNGQIVSTEFNLPFVEPDPLAAAISFTTSETATFTATIGTIDKKTIVDWGDGVVETKDTTSQLTFSHDYAGVSGDKQLDLTFKQGLKDVTYLDVSGQALSGYLSEVENMKSLQTLHGYSTSIQGDLAAIKELTALSDCQLYSTNLGTYSASKLPGSDWDNINIDINSCVDIDNQEASQLLIDLDDSYQRTIPSGGTLDISGCNGGTLAYADLTADGQAAYDDLTNNYGWTITTD